MVLYYTGTGNSEYVAKKIGEQTEDDVIMPENYIAVFNAPERNQDVKIIRNADIVIENTADVIKHNGTIPEGNRSKGKSRYQCPL